MKLDLKKQRDFSLVELMVVVAIIGILASIALPKFQGFQAKAKQAEAKTSLAAIYTYQMSFFGDNDSYFAAIPAGMFGSSSQRYTYATTGGAAFVATATAKSGKILASCQDAIDTWTIDQDKFLSNTVRGLGGCGL